MIHVVVTRLAGEALELEVSSVSHVGRIKEIIARKWQIPEQFQKILHGERVLQDLELVSGWACRTGHCLSGMQQLSLTMIVSVECARQSLESGCKHGKHYLHLLGKLGMRGGGASFIVLSAGLKDEAADVRQVAVQVLTKVAGKGDQQAINMASAMLNDNNAFVRETAVRALGQLGERGDQHVITAVSSRLNDSNKEVRVMARQALMNVAEKVDKELALEHLSSAVESGSAKRTLEACEIAKAAGVDAAQIDDARAEIRRRRCAALSAAVTSGNPGRIKRMIHVAETANVSAALIEGARTELRRLVSIELLAAMKSVTHLKESHLRRAEMAAVDPAQIEVARALLMRCWASEHSEALAHGSTQRIEEVAQRAQPVGVQVDQITKEHMRSTTLPSSGISARVGSLAWQILLKHGRVNPDMHKSGLGLKSSEAAKSGSHVALDSHAPTQSLQAAISSLRASLSKHLDWDIVD